MPRSWKIYICSWLLLCVSASSLVACGKKKSSHAESSPWQVPDYLKDPPLFSPVPVGSKDVLATPPPGELRGTLVLRLVSEPGAVIYYSYKDPGSAPVTSEMAELKENLHLLPPVSIWAVAAIGNETGPVRRFDYTLSKDYFDPIGTINMQRFPPVSFKQIPLSNSIEFIRYGSDADSERQQLKEKPDGTTTAWPGSGRYMLTDGLYDVPETLGVIDISWTQVNVSTQKIELLMSLRDKPRTGEGTVYGFDIGDSGISFSSFGKGTKFHYRIEAVKGALNLVDKGTNQPLPLSNESLLAIADAVEFSISLNDLPLLSGLKNLVVRPFAYDLNEGVMVTDRIEPYVVRTEFAVDRAVISLNDKKVWDINFLMDPAIAPESLSGKYLSMSGPLIDDLEKMNKIPFYSRGSLQLYFVDKEENGYAGLNTSDRGLLTTLGQQTSLVSKAQLLAHEYAHYQNARNSGINERWIQEGMSEWSAERYLYRHFPKRVVYKFMRRLRYDRYFEVTGDKLDAFPLSNWGTDSTNVGYEKSLMFTNLIERAIGQENLIRLYQIGVNAPIKTAEFKALAEHLSGKDLTDLFNFWAFDGQPSDESSPLLLFKDDDGDGLMGLDEDQVGTSRALFDTDADGYPDGEEYFRSMDPLTSLIDPEGTLNGKNVAVLVNSQEKDTMALARIGGEKGAAFSFSFNPASTAPEEVYDHPRFFRPPYSIAVQSKKDDIPGQVRLLQRDLMVNGVKVNAAYSQNHILPASPVASKTLLAFNTDIEVFDELGTPESTLALADNPNDLPDFLGSLDIVSVSSAETPTDLTFTVATRLTPDPYGQYGDVVLSFDENSWKTSGPDNRRVNALTLSAGAPFWHTIKDTVETAQLINSGVSFSYGKNLQITVKKSLLTEWMNSTQERLVCISSNIEIENGNKFKDRAGCLVFSSPGFVRSIGKAADQFGISDHHLEVFWNSSSSSAGRINNAMTVGLSAITAFEEILQRPLFDRNYWPIHLSMINLSPTYGSATLRAGSWLTTAPSLEGSLFDYLVVEQLARLVTTDLLERSGFVPFWMQEFLVQWLTSSAMYKIYPSKDVHAFHAGRIDDFNCFVDGTPSCANYFSGDIPLTDWNAATASSTGSVKSLMLALYLDAKLGADVIAKALGPWFSVIPSNEGMEAILTGNAPATAGVIASTFSTWVDGTNDAAADTAAVRAQFVDGDSDGLYLYEEEKLNLSDASVDTYLD